MSSGHTGKQRPSNKRSLISVTQQCRSAGSVRPLPRYVHPRKKWRLHGPCLWRFLQNFLLFLDAVGLAVHVIVTAQPAVEIAESFCCPTVSKCLLGYRTISISKYIYLPHLFVKDVATLEGISGEAELETTCPKVRETKRARVTRRHASA